MSLLRHLLFPLLLLPGLVVHAQQEGESLTREFAGMSAKERMRIAKREQAEAQADAQYQAMMEQADQLFRDARYEEALALYRQAREQRPYNVYPKVKIQDIQALIKVRDATEATEAEEAEETNEAASSAVPVEPADPVSTPQVVEKGPEPLETPVLVPVTKKEEPLPVQPPPPPAPLKALPPEERSRTAKEAPARERQLPVVEETMGEGFSQRVFKEGGHVVTERRVEGAEGILVYRRVRQSWGGVVHFRNGIPVPERVWVEAFGER